MKCITTLWRWAIMNLILDWLEMWKAKRESNFPWLAANLKEIYTAGDGFIRPYIIKNIGGVRIAIVGFITPGVPRWEIPEHYRGYQFEPIVEAAQRVIPQVHKQADLVVVIMHSGLDRDPATGKIFEGQENLGENAAWELAEQVPGIDMIFYGHTHSEMPELDGEWGFDGAGQELGRLSGAGGHPDGTRRGRALARGLETFAGDQNYRECSG